MSAVLMQGDEACAEGAIAAGCTFFAGYPITPATEIAEHMARRLPQVGGVFIQMEDEIASISAVIGAAVGGAKAMTATSGPGFSLMQENIGYAAMAEIPCVIVDVQRLGPSTGRPTSPSQGDVMQARWGTHGDHPIIALSPSSVREAFDLTVAAFNFAEKYRTPVILLMDEVVGHMREGVELPDPATIERVERGRDAGPAGVVQTV
jgi:2-oxoglutarate ferredoxin oxidoreductase subunit alpha